MTEHEEAQPDEIAEGAPDTPEVGFGEQDEAAQESEWQEDAEEGGPSEA